MIPKPAKKTKPKRPPRDDFELEEVAAALVEANEEQNEVILTIWQKEPIKGIVFKLDGRTKLIHVKKGYETYKVPFMDILNVSRPT